MLGHPAVQAVAAFLCKQLEFLEVLIHAPVDATIVYAACSPVARQYIFKHDYQSAGQKAQSRNASIKKLKIFESDKERYAFLHETAKIAVAEPRDTIETAKTR